MCPSTSVQTAHRLRHLPLLLVVHMLVSIFCFTLDIYDILMMDATIAKTPSYVYSRNTLLSLLPFADESMKGKMRENCPEVVMNRKTRKGLEFNGRSELFAAKQLLKQEQIRSASVVDKRPAAPTSPTPTPTSTLTRVSSRRSRPTGRAPERRRNPFTSTFGGRRTGDDSWRRLQAVPMPPVILL